MKRSIGHNAAAAFLVALMAPIQAHAAEVDETSLSAARVIGLDERLRSRCEIGAPASLDHLSPRLLAFTNGGVMTDMITEPAEFARLMEAAADPGSVQAMMACAPTPAVWDSWIASLSDLDSMSATASRIMNPGFFARWMMAPMDPQVQQSMARMMSPAAMGRWPAAVSQWSFYAPMMRLMDPGFYTARVQWAADARTFRPFLYLLESPQAAQ